jgi:hypothetical protein
MRRWTDGKSWSASRVSGSFLTYREMEGKRGGSFPAPTPAPKRASAKSGEGSAEGESEGEGPDGYRYKPDGLMKQSFSITTQNGQHLHLISYFSRSHATTLKTPTTDPNLRHIRPPKNMYPESTVNEGQSVPAVTRGPMPGSPYAPSPHQIGPASPYQRPPQQVYAPYPPTPPNGTPPFQYAYHPQYMQYAPVMYAHGYPPQGHMLDGPPQPLRNAHAPPPGYTLVPAHHPYAQQHPHAYAPHPGHLVHAGHHPIHPGPPGLHPQYSNAPPVPRPLQAPEHNPQYAQANAYRQAGPLPEQSVQLPAINGVPSPAPRAENKPPTPKPAEQAQTQAPLAVPEATGAAANNAPSPARSIPTLSLGSILNGHENDADKNQSNSRSGSRSPNGAQRPVRELPADRIASNSIAADTNALNKLNKQMFTR